MIVRRACGACEVVDLIIWLAVWLHDVLAKEYKMPVSHEWLYILHPAREEVVHAVDFVPFVQETAAEG